MASTGRADGLKVFALALVAVACEPERPRAPDLATCTSRFVSLSESAVVLRVGQLETVTFNVQVSWNCDGQLRQPEAITVEAVDDEGRDVGVEVRQTRESSPRADTVALEVTFTTPATSSVVFRLRAEPSLGLMQRSFPAVRLTTPTWDERSTPETCNGAIEGPPDSGLLFCVEANATVRLLDGPSWMHRNVNSAAFTTDATGVVRLWLFLTTGMAEVWRFDRGLPELAGTQPAALIPTALNARGRRVVIAGATPTNSVTLLQLEFAAEALGAALPPGVQVGALRFVSDDEVEVARGERLDVVRLSAGVTNVPLPVATRQPVAPVSVGPDGLWYAIDTGGTSTGVPGSGGGSASGNQDVQVVRPDGGVARVSISNRLGTGETRVRIPPMDLTDVVPIWLMGPTTTGTVVTAVPFDAPDGGLALRYFETEGTAMPSWASSQWVYGPPTPGRLLRLRRQP